LIQGNSAESIIEAIAAVWIIVCIYNIRRIGSIEWIYNSIAATIAALFLYLAYSGGPVGSKSYFSFIFPTITFFLLGIRRGVLWTLIFFLGLIFIFLNPLTFLQPYSYRIEAIFRFGVVFSSLQFLIAVMNRFAEGLKKTLKRRKSNLSTPPMRQKLPIEPKVNSWPI
jgi:hypothetical protein